MQGYVEFSFRLPTCLYLKDGHEFTFANEDAFVRVMEVFTEKDSRYGTASNMEVASDTDGGFHYTDLHIFIRDENPDLPESSLEKVYERKVIRVANRLLDAFRYLSDRPSIANIKDLCSMGNFRIAHHRPQGKTRMMMSIGFGTGGSLRTPPPPHSVEFHERMQDFCDGEAIPLEREFLMDAKRHLALGHDLQALISGVTALEIAVRGYQSPLIWKVLRFIRPGERISVIVREKLGSRLTEQNLSQITAAVRERNQIVHQGRRNLKGSISEYVDSISVAVIELGSNDI